MLLAEFQALMDDGTSVRLALCRCGHCDNTWFVPNIGENEASYCCYCGTKFRWYQDSEGVKKNLAGFPIGDQPQVDRGPL